MWQKVQAVRQVREDHFVEAQVDGVWYLGYSLQWAYSHTLPREAKPGDLVQVRMDSLRTSGPLAIGHQVILPDGARGIIEHSRPYDEVLVNGVWYLKSEVRCSMCEEGGECGQCGSMGLDRVTAVQLVACLRTGDWIIYEEMLKTPHWDKTTVDTVLAALYLSGVIRSRLPKAYQWIR